MLKKISLTLIVLIAAILLCKEAISETESPLIKSQTSSKFNISMFRAPDLSVERVEIKNAIPSVIRVTVKNLGDADTPSDWDLKIFIRPDRESIWHEAGSFSGRALKPGALATFEASYSQVHRGYMRAGDNEIRVVADPKRSIKDEINRKNNVYLSAFAWDPEGMGITIVSFDPKIRFLSNPNPLFVKVRLIAPKNLVASDFKLLFCGKEMDIKYVERNGAAYEISAIATREAGAGPIVVIAAQRIGISRSNLIIYGMPYIKQISPAEPNPGDTITIYGSNFVEPEKLAAVRGKAAVSFYPDNKKLVEYKYISEGEISAKVPDQATSGTFEVIMGNTPVAAYLKVRPKMTFKPTLGEAGSEVTVHITGIATMEKRTAVYFNDISSEARVIPGKDGISLWTRVPKRAGTGKVRIIAPGNISVSSTDDFRVLDPVLLSVTPEASLLGYAVVIKGRDLDIMTDVSFIKKCLGMTLPINYGIRGATEVNENMIPLPPLNDLLASIRQAINNVPQGTFKTKPSADAFVEGPILIKLRDPYTRKQWTDPVKVTLIGNYGWPVRDIKRKAVISQVSPESFSIGDQITLYGDDLFIAGEASIKIAALGDAMFNCQIIGTPEKNKMTIKLPQEKDVRSKSPALPKGMTITGEASLYVRYVSNIEEAPDTSNYRLSAPFKVILK